VAESIGEATRPIRAIHQESDQMPSIPLPSPTIPSAGAMPTPVPLPVRATITPWVDPVVDRRGHDPRSRYVELFWLGTLGPTATWLMRRLAAGFDRAPDGYELDLPATARALGLSIAKGSASPFAKALQRCVMFGLAQSTAEGLAVRRRVPTAPQRHLSRLPADVQAAHDEWQRATIRLDGLERARRLATAMLDAGDDLALVEPQLVALGVLPRAAAEAYELALGSTGPTPPTAA
jgi:hypothetical protein